SGPASRVEYASDSASSASFTGSRPDQRSRSVSTVAACGLAVTARSTWSSVASGSQVIMARPRAAAAVRVRSSASASGCAVAEVRPTRIRSQVRAATAAAAASSAEAGRSRSTTSSGPETAPASSRSGNAAGPYGSASSAGPITGAIYHHLVPEPTVSASFPASPGEAERVDDWERSGAAVLTGRAGGPTLVPPGWAASLAKAMASLLPVEIEGPALLGERAAFTGQVRRGSVSASGACRLLPTTDGWAAVSCARPDDPVLLRALIEDEGPGEIWAAVARWLLQHSGAELADRAALLGVAAHPVRSRPATVPALASSLRPAAGLRVVDFSALWAGPLCANLLGLAGADIIKVETPGRPDGARLGNRDFYRLLHAGHRSVVLDPGVARGRAAVAALTSSADIVIESSRPRALAGWGLRPEGTAATWISMTDVVAGTVDGSHTTAARRPAPPRARQAAGEAHPPGADTDAVLREL